MSGGFANPLVGGDGKLVFPQIKSPNFSLAGKTGWAILKNGSAYFFSVTAEGVVTATEFDGTDFNVNSSGAFFYNGPPAPGNLALSIAQFAGTDIYTNTYPAGVAVYDNVNSIFAQLATGVLTLGQLGGPDTGNVTWTGGSRAGGPAGSVLSLGAVDGATTLQAALDLLAPDGTSPGAVYVYGWEPGAADVTAMPLNVSGLISHLTPGPAPVVETWHVPALSGGWSQASGLTVQYTYLPVGLLAIAGRIKAGTVTAGTIVMTLPAGYYPTTGTISIQCRNVSGNGTVNFTLNTSGQLQYQSGASANDTIDLDSVKHISMTN